MLIKVDLRLPLHRSPCLFTCTALDTWLDYATSVRLWLQLDMANVKSRNVQPLLTLRATRDLWLTLMLAGDFAPEHFRLATMHSAEAEYAAAARNTRKVKTVRRL